MKHLYVHLWETAPGREEIDSLSAGCAGPDRLCAGRRALYLLCCQSIRDSKLTAEFGKLNTSVTARNLKTMTKRYGMLSAE